MFIPWEGNRGKNKKEVTISVEEVLKLFSQAL
jgi:hypothetical protein